MLALKLMLSGSCQHQRIVFQKTHRTVQDTTGVNGRHKCWGKKIEGTFCRFLWKKNCPNRRWVKLCKIDFARYHMGFTMLGKCWDFTESNFLQAKSQIRIATHGKNYAPLFAAAAARKSSIADLFPDSDVKNSHKQRRSDHQNDRVFFSGPFSQALMAALEMKVLHSLAK